MGKVISGKNMAEQSIYFNSGDLKLEGLVEERPGQRGVIITHPHPLYGGSMHNNVVDAILGSYRDQGITTLRFNFRGVDGSEGSFDEGKGEVDDLRAAIDYLKGLGKTRLALAGYSFGAWVIYLGLDNYEDVEQVLMVSPPVDAMSFDSPKATDKIRFVASGDQDEYGSPESVEKIVSIWNPGISLNLIKGANHFYSFKETELKKSIDLFLAE